VVTLRPQRLLDLRGGQPELLGERGREVPPVHLALARRQLVERGLDLGDVDPERVGELLGDVRADRGRLGTEILERAAERLLAHPEAGREPIEAGPDAAEAAARWWPAVEDARSGPPVPDDGWTRARRPGLRGGGGAVAGLAAQCVGARGQRDGTGQGESFRA
jgi:hypothetical protein